MSDNNLVLRVAVPLPLRQCFDYLLPKDCDSSLLKPGMRILVPFQNRQHVSILLELSNTPQWPRNKLKAALEILDSEPVIPEDILKLCQWTADYYHHPIGEVLCAALPALLRQGKPATCTSETIWQITPLGLENIATVPTRAPQQAKLLTLLANHPEGLSSAQLTENNIVKSVLKPLLQKHYLNSIERPLAVLPLPKSVQAPLELNAAQQTAVTEILAAQNKFQVFLLDGVTGSGKTEVYLQCIAEVLKANKQALVLVPEIGLTPQTIERFRRRFSKPVVALHSGLSDRERLNAWLMAKSGEAGIIIGTRSAIFSPLANVGIIIIDEEHDLSFKQQDSLRYHARDLAVMRAHFDNIPIVLGSATPALESIHNAARGRYQHLHLPERAGGAAMPTFHLLNIRSVKLDEGLSPLLVQEIRRHLDAGDQVLLFLNRRGFAPVLMCHGCGWIAGCKRCDARMTFHQQPTRLHCHHCDAQRPMARACESCGATEIFPLGLGTERLEKVLNKYFPDMPIARIDRDSTQRKGSMESLLEGIQRQETRILLGTQMLAKGHHFPNVTLVAIVDADSGFFSSDFRAVERMGQLLIQVAGRAGRAEKPGVVFIQTHHADHPLLFQLTQEHYQSFANTLLDERKITKLPPFTFFALFRADAHVLENAETFLRQVKSLVEPMQTTHLQLLGPIPATMSRVAGRHRAQLLIQTTQRAALHELLNKLLPKIDALPSQHRVRWSLDVDPLEVF